MESFEKEIKVNNILKALQVEFSSNVNSGDNLIKAVILITEVLNVKLKNNDISKEYFEKSCSVVSDIVKSHPNSEYISQILDEIEKGRKAQVGEVRVWGNERKQKQSDGSWKTIERLGSKKQKKGEEEPEEKSGSEKTVMGQRADPKQSEITIKGKPWEFDKRAMENFSKEERDQVVGAISEGWAQIKHISVDESKVEIEPGGNYTIEQFVKSLPKVKSEASKRKFLKEKSDGFYSYVIHDRISKESVENLVLAVGENYSLYNFFNTKSTPYDISKKELFQITEKVESNNIYSKMAANEYKVEEISFKVNVNSGKPPVTITSRIVRDSTLSMGDIVSFM